MLNEQKNIKKNKHENKKNQEEKQTENNNTSSQNVDTVKETTNTKPEIGATHNESNSTDSSKKKNDQESITSSLLPPIEESKATPWDGDRKKQKISLFCVWILSIATRFYKLDRPPLIW